MGKKLIVIVLLWSWAVMVGGFPPPDRGDAESPMSPAPPRHDAEPLPLRFSRKEVAADHKALEEGTLGKNKDTSTDDTPMELPVHNRRIIKVFSLLHIDPEEQAKTIEEIKARIFATIPKLDDKTEVDVRELKLLEIGLWARCYWLRPLPPPLQDGDQCSVKELQFLIDKM